MVRPSTGSRVQRLSCLALLVLVGSAAALQTAVPPEDPTPEAKQLPAARSLSQSIMNSLAALWSGSNAAFEPLKPAAASGAAAAGGADLALDPSPAPPRGWKVGYKAGGSSSGVTGAVGKLAPAQLRKLTRSSSEAARAAWADAARWAEQPWPLSSAARAYVQTRPRVISAWWLREDVNILRDPWGSTGKVLRASGHELMHATREFWALVRPGGKLHPTKLFESQGHLAVEAALILLLLGLLAQRTYKPGSPALDRLTEKEVDELCADWQPDPLGNPVPGERTAAVDPPIIASGVGPWVVADGRRVLNMASLDFLGIAGDPEIQAVCRKTIEKYGVGACGPRGFYGTIDVHLALEERIARFMGTQEAILYSYDLSTVPSVLPAFANKRDLIICDEAVSFPVQNGVLLSRARVLFFKHNDTADLEKVLQKVAAEDVRNKRVLNRRFIMVEGIYANTGEVAPLATISHLKYKYKYRLVVDESFALGVLGGRGRGAAEAAGLSPSDVDILCASLGNSLASVGGFCAGSREIVDHQRLSGLGYVFSAALPPYLATAATAAIERIEREALGAAATANARRLRGLLQHLPGLKVVGGDADADSPVIHIQLTRPKEDHALSEGALSDIAAEALKRDNVLLAVHRLATNDRCAAKGASPLPPSLRLAVSATHETDDLEKAAAAVRRATAHVLKKQQSPIKRRPSLHPATSATL